LGLLGAEAEPAIPELSRLFHDGDEDQAGRVAQLFPDIGLKGVDPLTRLLATTNHRKRVSVLMALSQYATPQYRWSERKLRSAEEIDTAAKAIVPVLLPYLTNSDPDLLVSAIYSLGEFARAPELVVPMLGRLLKSSNSDTRTRDVALQALQNYGPRAECAAPDVVAVLQDPDPYIRDQAASALKRIAPQAAVGNKAELTK
jgi:HEAT repeat protein